MLSFNNLEYGVQHLQMRFSMIAGVQSNISCSILDKGNDKEQTL